MQTGMGAFATPPLAGAPEAYKGVPGPSRNPGYHISSRRLIRSQMGGWVEKSFSIVPIFSPG